MGNEKKFLSIGEVKELDIVDYLSKLGYEADKIKNPNYWYRSPIRQENTASFKVNRNLNRWYDHGIGKGGNIIDFGILYYKCSVAEFLQKINDNFSFQQPLIHQPNHKKENSESKIIIVKVRPLSSFPLLNYLNQRGIPPKIAIQYCEELIYRVNGKNYYGIGFKNDSGGYEIRNPYFKGSSSPKDMTTIRVGAEEVNVFEGFTDFLSFKVKQQNQPSALQDFAILNSVSFFERARQFLERHERVRLYLDRDTTGQNCSSNALSLGSKYIDESYFYAKYKDLNDWLVNKIEPQKKKQRLKPG